MSSALAWALALGATLGLGLWSLVSLMPRLGRPRLADRVAPFVADFSTGARTLLAQKTVHPLPIFGAVIGPVGGRVRAAFGRLLGGSNAVALRLNQTRSSLTVEEFRGRQLTWALIGLGVGIAVAAALSQARGLPLVVHPLIMVVFAASGPVLCDYLLQRGAAGRMSRIAGELPTVLEFLTLSLAAGEGITDALRRVSQISRGELANEIAAVLGEVNSGIPLAEALRALSRRIQLPALARCVEQLTGALDRGTPLAEVLRAQAQDSRDDAKRRLLEVAGKKEVAMLVPVIFLILPTTIVFAIFPGIFVLQVGF